MEQGLNMTTRFRFTAFLLVMVAWYVGGIQVGLAQDEIPRDKQMLLIMKVMGYDRNLPDKLKDRSSMVKIGVLFEAENKISEQCRDEILKIIETLSGQFNILGHKVSGIEVPFSADLSASLGQLGVHATYFCDGIDTELASAISSTQEAKVLSVSGHTDIVTQGVSVGFGLEKNKAKIFVNLKSSVAEGVNLSSAFLRIAHVINR